MRDKHDKATTDLFATPDAPVENPHHPDCPATDGFGCHCDELGPWERDPLPTVYDHDDYPVEEPPPCPADAERAARAWEADRLTRGEP